MGQPIVHFEIMGQDSQRLQAFYRDLFGWNIAAAGGAETGFYALVDGGSSGLAGGIGQSPGGQSRVTIYVRVPDLEEAMARATALGGSVAMPPMAVPGGATIAMVLDPDGNATGLMQG